MHALISMRISDLYGGCACVCYRQRVTVMLKVNQHVSSWNVTDG